MITKILAFFANQTDVNKFLAIAAGVVTTVFGSGHLSAAVIAVVNTIAGVVVIVDTAYVHSRAKAAEQATADRITAQVVAASNRPRTATVSQGGVPPAS